MSLERVPVRLVELWTRQTGLQNSMGLMQSRTNFVITTSLDGHLKLWKKQENGIEFVKHYRASLKAIVGVCASEDGKLFATVSEGGEGRVFDVVNFGTSTVQV